MASSICAFGDSIMKGVVFDSMRGRYSILQNSFANVFSEHTGVKIDNFAKFGCTIATGSKMIKKHAAELSRYEYVALEFGGNDSDMDWAAISENPDKEHMPKTPVVKFESVYSKIIDKIIACGSQPILFSLPPIDAHKYFSWVSKELNAGNILRWLGDIQHIYRWQEIYNLAVLRLAAIKRVPLIDIRRAFLESNKCPNLYCEDGIHPNEAGHALIADMLCKY